jgi:hypothetical protein
MLLTISLNDLLGPPAVDPALQGAQLFQGCLMRLLQFFIRRSCLVKYTLQLRRLLKSGQQELMALSQVIGKNRSVIHNAHCCSDSRNE